MRYIISLVAVALINCFQPSKGQSLEQGNVNISLSHGLLSPGNLSANLLLKAIDLVPDSKIYDLTIKNYGSYFAKGEYMVSEKSGIGLNLAFISNNISFSDSLTNNVHDLTRNNLSVLFRYNYYILSKERFDLYAGIGLGGRLGGWKISQESLEFLPDTKIPALSPIGAELTVGFRTYLIQNLAFFGELGVSKGITQFGLAYRL
jgi:hypothetical protein